MSEWKEFKLSDVTEYINRGVTPSYSDEGVIVINQKCVRDGQVKYEQSRFTNPEKKKIPLEKFLKSYDILINSTGQGTLGRVGQVKNISYPTTVDSHLTIVRANKSNDPVYLGYVLKSKQKAIEDLAEGTTGQTELSRHKVAALSISLPGINKQKIIAEILSSLDDKIELNNKINQELESLAQLLFKRWFVDFEFPNENGESYKSSGGEMVDSEMGVIPKGWSVDYLSNVFDFLEGPGLRNWQYRLEGMPFINIRLIQNGDILKNNISFISNEEFEDKYKHFALNENDLVLSTSGTLGKSAIVRKNHLPLMLNTSVIRFRPIRSHYKCFMYQYLQSKIFIDEVKASATGSVQLNFGPMHLKKIKLIKPDDSLIKKFENAFSSVYKQIQKNKDENDGLSLLRDTLLPKLISGELQINEN